MSWTSCSLWEFLFSATSYRRLCRFSKVLLEEVPQCGQVDHVSLPVHVKDDVFRSAQVLVCCPDLLHRLTGAWNVELADRLSQAVLALHGPGRERGVAVGG